MMSAETAMEDKLAQAEGLLLQGQDEPAEQLLARLAEDAEEYVDRNCPTTDEVQWFDFPTIFERLAYHRVESDPRELRDIGEPLERLYGDFALAEVHLGDYDGAMRALKQAIRWNPMNCEHRLNLADLYRVSGDMKEYLALTYSVFERASDAKHLARAFANFANWFASTKKPRVAAAALRAGRRLETGDSVLEAALKESKGTDHDPDEVSDAETQELLGKEGLPDGANAEIAICLLMCATDAAGVGERDLATKLTVRARDLVGESAAMALLQLIRADDVDSKATHDSKGSDGSGSCASA
jgi:tetratricopeptide (TPR) repeat protein